MHQPLTRCIRWRTPLMGVVLWGASPLYESGSLNDIILPRDAAKINNGRWSQRVDIGGPIGKTRGYPISTTFALGKDRRNFRRSLRMDFASTLAPNCSSSSESPIEDLFNGQQLGLWHHLLSTNVPHHGVARVDVVFKNRLAAVTLVHAMVRGTEAANGYASPVTVAQYFSIPVTLNSDQPRLLESGADDNVAIT